MTHLRPLWSTDAAHAHHLSLEAETNHKTGPVNFAGMVLTRTMFDTHETRTASGIQQPVQITDRNSTTVRAVRQATTDNKDNTHSDWTIACTAGPETANLTRDKVDTRGMPEDRAGKRALNSCDLTQHPQNSALA